MEESIKIIRPTDESLSGIRHGHILNNGVLSGKCFDTFLDQQKNKGVTAQGAAKPP